jgi:hypothetical protein
MPKIATQKIPLKELQVKRHAIGDPLDNVDHKEDVEETL